MPKWQRYVGLLTGGMLLAGCLTQPAAVRVEPEAPRELPSAAIHIMADPEWLDPTFAQEGAGFDILGNLYEGLVRLGDDGAIQPGAAARWEQSSPTEYTFHLREGLRWSDGQPVTAGDFITGWLRVLDPAHGSPYSYLLYDIAGAAAWNTGIEGTQEQIGIAAPDTSTLVVRLQAPSPQFLRHLAHPIAAPQRADVITAQGDRYGQSGGLFPSNGPFQLERWDPGVLLSLRPNPYYWDGGESRLERLTFRVEPDATKALRLYEIGQLDLVVLPGELAAKRQGVHQMAQPSTMALVLQTAASPFTNRNLRQAINQAIDRRRLASQVAGANALAASGLIPPSITGGAGLAFREKAGRPLAERANPMQTQQFWRAARQELGADELTIRLLHTPESLAVAEALQTMLEEGLRGLHLELESVPFAQRLERVRLGQFEAVLQGYVADVDDPLSLLQLQTTDALQNDARWSNPTFDRLVRQASLTADQPDRLTALAEAEGVLLQDLPLLPLYHPVRHWLVQPWLRGVKYAPLGGRVDLKAASIDGKRLAVR